MLSVFDLFSVGIGPSSSHTVAPMRAARAFLESLDHAGSLGDVCTLSVELYGSLAATGRAHGTGKALLLGFEGEDPATVDVATIERRVAQIRRRHRVSLLGRHEITFEESTDVILHRDELLPIHPNAMRFSAWRADGSAISSRTSYSIGGGLVLDDITAQRPAITKVPHPFTSAGQLLHLCETSGLRISDVVLEPPCAARRRASRRVARQGPPYDAPDRRGHEDEVQGDRAGWPGTEHHRVLRATLRRTGSVGAAALGQGRR